MAATIFGFSLRTEAALVDGIDAIVHDSIITFQEIKDATAPYADELRAQFGNQQDVYKEKLNDAIKENRERLLENQLILHEFATAGYNLPESIIDEQLQEYIKSSRYHDRVTLIKSLQQDGITYEKFRQQYKERFIIEQMRYKNISGEIIISPHKIETYYAEHKDEFKVEDEVKLQMIVLNVSDEDKEQKRKLAGEILAHLNEGQPFTDMASVYSQSPDYKIGSWVNRYNSSGDSILRKELADVAFTLKSGEHSGIIETPGAFYILHVEDKHPSHIKALPEVRDDIETILQAKERTRLQEQWIARLKKKTFVRTFPDF
jgi:peptidyl-prolyl cis-trans isomerase SurA